MRIVSLCPSLTELVFDLGRGSDVVGVTKFCVHPAAGVAAVEKVGGTKDPKVERIVELAPDVVLMNVEENRRADHDELVAAGLRCHSSFPKTVADAAQMIRDVGECLERGAQAEALARDVEGRASRVRAQAATRPAVPFAYLVWRAPWMTVNEMTFAHDLLHLAGGENVFGSMEQRYPSITLAELASAAPELVLLPSEPFPFAEAHAAELAAGTGLQRAAFRLVDGELLTWHGSRTRSGIDYAEQCILGARRANR